MGIERDEFESWMGVLREDIKGVHSRLDTLNGRTLKNTTDIAVLMDRGEQDTKDPTARYTAYGSAVGAMLAGAYAWFHK